GTSPLWLEVDENGAARPYVEGGSVRTGAAWLQRVVGPGRIVNLDPGEQRDRGAGIGDGELRRQREGPDGDSPEVLRCRRHGEHAARCDASGECGRPGGDAAIRYGERCLAHSVILRSEDYSDGATGPRSQRKPVALVGAV